MLKHLIIVPEEGLCNRIRAIAAAKRVCSVTGARCTVIWPWGDYHALFKQEAAVDWLPEIPAGIEKYYYKIRHLTRDSGGNHKNRRISINDHEHLIVFSQFSFSSIENKERVGEIHLQPWLPQPSDMIRKKVEAFVGKYFDSPVGLHIRGGDNEMAIRMTPIELYISEAYKSLNENNKIFLATDSRALEVMMKREFGDKIIIYPKSERYEIRWPREEFIFEETVSDMVDLHLLAACDYVLGSAGSSYSRIAILYNGSSKCKALRLGEPS
ncbi:MAG TPA: hypothetical protein VK717_01690 [Opitutaceae bacterium]|jgi:hypothetical protein|nr:hypothetical protein [Opitutaceae bacterium]